MASDSEGSVDGEPWDGDGEHASMAASAQYIPGASLSDKLRLAASKGHVDKVRELLASGATFEADREGRTAIHYAALNNHPEVVRLLAAEGCDIDGQDKLGYTALHRSSAQGHLEVIRMLLYEGCLVDRQDEVHGNAALHEASWNGYSKTLELLVKQKANVHIINKAGFSALHLAAQNGHNQSARVLLYAGCNPDHRNNYGDAALHTAARYGHAGVTRILISAHCKINAQNKNGDTALHISSALKRRKLATLLVESGIKTNIKNKQGETAVDVARRKEHGEMILIITSQSKASKKKKKLTVGFKKGDKKGSKLGVNSIESEEEKKDKKSFFKKKSQAKEPEIQSDEKPPMAASEVSSSDLHSNLGTDDNLRASRQHVAGGPPAEGQGHAHARGTSTSASRKSTKKGLLSQYESKPGVQYFRDLAGNIKQGPVGYAPVCQCQPVLKKLEKKLEANRTNIYDHIETSHKLLASRIDDVTRQTSQQVFSIDKLTRERLTNEKRQNEEFFKSQYARTQQELGGQCDQRHVTMRRDLERYVDKRVLLGGRCDVGVGGRGERGAAAGASRTYRDLVWRGYKDNEYVDGQAGYEDDDGAPEYNQDDMLNRTRWQDVTEEAPLPGRLYKCKSDESLSVHSSRHSKMHWKLRARAMEEASDFRLPRDMERVARREQRAKSHSAAREPPGEDLARRARSASRELLASAPGGRSGAPPGIESHHGGRPHSGRTPEGEEQPTYQDFMDRQQHWAARRLPIKPGLARQLDGAEVGVGVGARPEPERQPQPTQQHQQQPPPPRQYQQYPSPHQAHQHQLYPQQRPPTSHQYPHQHPLPAHHHPHPAPPSHQNPGPQSRHDSHTLNVQADVHRWQTPPRHPPAASAQPYPAQAPPTVVSGYRNQADQRPAAQSGAFSAPGTSPPRQEAPQRGSAQAKPPPSSRDSRETSSGSGMTTSRSIHSLDTPPRPGTGPSNGRPALPQSVSYDSADPSRALTQAAGVGGVGVGMGPTTPSPSPSPSAAAAAPANTPNNECSNWNTSTSSAGTTPGSRGSLYPSPVYPPSTGSFARTDSSSNPDSGYGSRLLYNARQLSGSKPLGSTSSSFQSNPDHNASLATTTSSTSSPGLPGLPGSPASPLVGPQQQQARSAAVPDIVNRWYAPRDPCVQLTQKQDPPRVWPPQRAPSAGRPHPSGAAEPTQNPHPQQPQRAAQPTQNPHPQQPQRAAQPTQNPHPQQPQRAAQPTQNPHPQQPQRPAPQSLRQVPQPVRQLAHGPMAPRPSQPQPAPYHDTLSARPVIIGKATQV